MKRLRGQRKNKCYVYAGTGLGLVIIVTAALTIIGGIPAGDVVTIMIATDPPAATVQLDGVPIGQTPIGTLVPEGEHDLIISKAGYKIIDRKIFADPSAPPQSTRYAFGLTPTAETMSASEKSRRANSLRRRAEDAFKRGDYVAPEHDNAWYYLNKLQQTDHSNPFIIEMRQRIRRVLKQQAEMIHRRNDLG